MGDLTEVQHPRFARAYERPSAAAERRGTWSRVGGDRHLGRDTAEAIRRAGFAIEEPDRFGHRPVRVAPPLTHGLGRARG